MGLPYAPSVGVQPVAISPVGAPPPSAAASAPNATSMGTVAIDGTPVRVAGFAVISAAVLLGLKLSGIRFNVGVGN